MAVTGDPELKWPLAITGLSFPFSLIFSLNLAYSLPEPLYCDFKNFPRQIEALKAYQMFRKFRIRIPQKSKQVKSRKNLDKKLFFCWCLESH
jgi:hypothetical protein